MYGPLSDALNYGLACLSKIEVDGLPKFGDDIVFVPWDEGMPSDRVLKGSMFKPDIILMSFATACDFRGITDRENLEVSQFMGRIPKKAPPKAIPSKNVPKNIPHKKKNPKTTLTNRIGWKDVLSAVEVKRDPNTEWHVIGNFTNKVPQISNEGLDELLQSPSPDPDPATPSDVPISQSQTRKVHALMYGQTTEELYSCNFKICCEQEADRE